jgi:DNA processing protein
MTSTRETAAIIALLRMQPVAAREVADLVEDHGSAAVALEHVHTRADDDGLQLFTLAPVDVEEAVDLAAIEAEVEAWLAEGMAITTILDPKYPENLHTVHDRPPLLFVHGALRPTDERSVAVVGTRQASPDGLECASTMARTMVNAGYVVVSGLAAGIDTAAHRAALDAGGRTVAVIGTGLRHAFPKENAELQRELGETNAVVSQFWPDQGPRRWTFPARNAVMSGFARATVIIEASDTSGARTHARLALEHGRPVFLLRSLMRHRWARAHSERAGSHVIDTADEVLEILEREYSTDIALTV